MKTNSGLDAVAHLAKIAKDKKVRSEGVALTCGCLQVVSDFRIKMASSGAEQHAVWCVDCEAWSDLAISNIEQEDSVGSE